jgi:tRNA G10  N-methylase Trm11
MKTFFILGRNPELSRVEILEFLKARNQEHKEILFEENILIIETNDKVKFNIQEFGGTMWLGQINFEGNNQALAEYLNKTEIIPADKFSYAIFGNQDPEILKDKFKERKKKAMIKRGGKQIKFQNQEKQELPSADFYIFYHEHKGVVYLGTSTQKYDNTDVKKRDMKKPARREHLAISPRLSKILINISGAKPNTLLLDPFCGIGGILQEALIKNINVHGIDKDKQATIGAEQNLKWLTSEYKINSKYTIQNIDSRKTPDLQFAAIATETPLGKVLRQKPSEKEAKQIIQNFEAYMIPILQRLKKCKKPNAKIAITFPAIRDHHANAQKIAEKTRLKIYIKPILESRSDQFISRDILVLQ